AHLGEREPEMRQVDVREKRVVAAGGLRPAFDDVTRGDRPGQLVVVRARPPEVGGGGADEYRRVGDPAGDDDVGAAGEAFDDAPCSEVGVRGQWAAEPELGRPR